LELESASGALDEQASALGASPPPPNPGSPLPLPVVGCSGCSSEVMYEGLAVGAPFAAAKQEKRMASWTRPGSMKCSRPACAGSWSPSIGGGKSPPPLPSETTALPPASPAA